MNNCDMVEFIMVTKTISGGVIAIVLIVLGIMAVMRKPN